MSSSGKTTWQTGFRNKLFTYIQAEISDKELREHASSYLSVTTANKQKDIDFISTDSRFFGQTPVIFAYRRKRWDLVKFFLSPEGGAASVDYPDGQGNTLRHLAKEDYELQRHIREYLTVPRDVKEEVINLPQERAGLVRALYALTDQQWILEKKVDPDQIKVSLSLMITAGVKDSDIESMKILLDSFGLTHVITRKEPPGLTIYDIDQFIISHCRGQQQLFALLRNENSEGRIRAVKQFVQAGGKLDFIELGSKEGTTPLMLGS